MNNIKLLTNIVLYVVVLSIISVSEAFAGSIPEYKLTFNGTASGGSLVIASTRNRNQRYISIQTSPGESAQSIVTRLADTINNTHMMAKESPGQFYSLWLGGYQASASEDTLTLPGGISQYLLAGTESGLGIPKPPTSLSCSYSKDEDQVILKWINPVNNYDFILVVCFWTDFDEEYTKKISGDSTSLVIDRKKIPINIDDLNILVIGFRNNIPSNASAISLSGNCQQELFGIPFTNGIAPNWKAWSTGPEVEFEAFKEEDKFPGLSREFYNPALALLTKPFYQVIKGSKRGNIHGIYRKFMGLTPYHTYRIIASLTTLDMDSVEEDWSASLCVAYNSKGENNFTAEQLAGVSALPNGKKGEKAGEVVSFGKGEVNTQKKFLIVCGDPNSYVTLPGDTDTITVWVRFNCKSPDGKIGFSGIRLEDITMSEDIKTPQQIQREEIDQECTLVNRGES